MVMMINSGSKDKGGEIKKRLDKIIYHINFQYNIKTFPTEDDLLYELMQSNNISKGEEFKLKELKYALNSNWKEINNEKLIKLLEGLVNDGLLIKKQEEESWNLILG